jgi:hypothetical protein
MRCDIFENRKYADESPYASRVSFSLRTICYWGYGGDRRACARQSPRHDRELCNFGFARASASPGLCGSTGALAAYGEETGPLWSKRPEGESGGYFEVFRADRREPGDRSQARNSLSLDPERRSPSRRRSRPHHVQRCGVVRRGRSYDFHRRSREYRGVRWRATVILPRQLPTHRALSLHKGKNGKITRRRRERRGSQREQRWIGAGFSNLRFTPTL